MPIHAAAEAGNFQIISMLIEAGADVNSTDNDGVTPLMILAQRVHAASFQKRLHHALLIVLTCLQQHIVDLHHSPPSSGPGSRFSFLCCSGR